METTKTTRTRKRAPTKPDAPAGDGNGAKPQEAAPAAMAPKAEIVLPSAGGDGLSNAQRALVSRGAQKMRRVGRITTLAIDEVSRIEEYAVFKVLSTNCSVGFLKQTAELSGAYCEEDQAFVEHLHRAYLTRLATIVGASTERVVDLAHGYAEKEPGFREFLVAQFHEEIEI